MANIRTQPVIEDTGSEQVKKLTDSYNALLEALGTFMDTVETAAGASAAAATAFLATVESDTTAVTAIGRQPGVPERPSRPVTS